MGTAAEPIIKFFHQILNAYQRLADYQMNVHPFEVYSVPNVLLKLNFTTTGH